MRWTDWLFLSITVVPTLIWLWALVATLLMLRHIRSLDDVPENTFAALTSGTDDVAIERDSPQEQSSPYVVTVVIPACNEADFITASVESLLAQELPLHLVVVNDRSTDDTGAILDQIAAREPRVTVIHIETLPEAWLGKLNALHQGVQHSQGRWLLFADADVVFSPDALARAVAYAEQHQLDLLTAVPKILSAGALGDLALNAGSSMIGAAGKLWKVSDPDSDVAAGMGVFILIRRDAFLNTPGFPWLKLEVADDIGLGLLLKRHGGRCEVVNAVHHISIQWYDSFTEFAQKTQKNFFGILGRFSLLRTWMRAGLMLWIAWFFLALFLPLSAPWMLGIPLIGWACMTAATVLSNRWMARPLWPSFLPSIGLSLNAWAMLRAGWLGWRMGGISWRGVLYPSELLRAEQKVKF